MLKIITILMIPMNAWRFVLMVIMKMLERATVKIVIAVVQYAQEIL